MISMRGAFRVSVDECDRMWSARDGDNTPTNQRRRYIYITKWLYLLIHISPECIFLLKFFVDSFFSPCSLSLLRVVAVVSLSFQFLDEISILLRTIVQLFTGVRCLYFIKEAHWFLFLFYCLRIGEEEDSAIYRVPFGALRSFLCLFLCRMSYLETRAVQVESPMVRILCISIPTVHLDRWYAHFWAHFFTRSLFSSFYSILHFRV